MNQENGKGILFGILGILTLIIAIMGASLAYFTATAMDTDPETIVVQAATVTISYVQGTSLTANDLIPTSFDVAEWAYKRGLEQNSESGVEVDQKCKDAKGYTVCSVFRFDVSNELGKNDTAIVGTITTITDTTKNKNDAEFDDLMYTIYEVNKEGDNVTNWNKLNLNNTKFLKKNVPGLNNVNGVTELFNHNVDPSDTLKANEVRIKAGEVKHFEMLIWLNELSTDLENDDGSGKQDGEQGLSYEGEIKVSVSGASDKITGTMGE